MNNGGPTAFILLTGAGLKGWIWDDVRPSLRLPSVVVEYPNRNLEKSNKDLHFVDYVEDAYRQVNLVAAEKYIVVGHSIGGVVGLALAEKLGQRMVGFIGLSAAIPKDGASFASMNGFPMAVFMRLLLGIFGTKPPEKAIKQGLANDLSEAVAKRLNDEFIPEAADLYFAQVRNPGFKIPTMYIRTTKDNQMNQDIQERMVANLGTKNVATIDAGHMSMLSAPDRVAQLLNAFADENQLT